MSADAERKSLSISASADSERERWECIEAFMGDSGVYHRTPEFIVRQLYSNAANAEGERLHRAYVGTQGALGLRNVCEACAQD